MALDVIRIFSYVRFAIFQTGPRWIQGPKGSQSAPNNPPKHITFAKAGPLTKCSIRPMAFLARDFGLCDVNLPDLSLWSCCDRGMQGFSLHVSLSLQQNGEIFLEFCEIVDIQ